MKTAVVVPTFRPVPSELETVSLRQCCSVLSSHPLIFVVPEDLDVTWYREFCQGVTDVRFERFDPSCFRGIEGYSRMMISPAFYARFRSFDYIFIHQLDVYCFQDSLAKWTSLSYDYIGAPWINASWHDDVCNGIKVTIFRQQQFLVRQWTKMKWSLRGLRNSRLNVGNGGCSLRKVSTFHQIATQYPPPGENLYNEDLYWSIFVPLSFATFRIADRKTALGFAFDAHAADCYELAGGELPMAAHGWFRDDEGYRGNPEFWKRFIGQ